MTDYAIVIILARIGAAQLIVKWPLAGLLMSNLLDLVDFSLLASEPAYQSVDKLLDTYYLSLLLTALPGQADRRLSRLLIGLFAWRMTGVGLLLATGQESILLLFPNLFEPLMAFYLLFRLITGRTRLLHGRRQTATIIAALLVPKLIQEYLLHIQLGQPVSLPIMDQLAALPAPIAAALWLTLPLTALLWQTKPSTAKEPPQRLPRHRRRFTG